MTKMPIVKTLHVVAVVAAIVALGELPAQAASALYSISSNDNVLRRIDPATGATISGVPITLEGETVLAGNGLAAHPQTGRLFALVQLDGQPGQRQLVTVDPLTGVAASIGNTTGQFAGLAFLSDGTLLGVTGDCNRCAAAPLQPETLFTLDQATGAPTLFQPLGNGDDGEAIAFDPDDGFLYHASGINDEVFEKVNLTTHAVTNIPRSGFDGGEVTALAWSQGSFLAGNLDGDFLAITTDGEITSLGVMDHVSKGLAFAVAPPPATTLVASVLPSSRSVVAEGDPATAFVTVINAGAATASSVGIALTTPLPAFLSYQTTDPQTNALTGTPDTPVDIGPGQSQTYLIALSAYDVFDPTEVVFSFAGTNTDPATTLVGINTLLVSSSETPVPDIVALAATLGNDGVVHVAGSSGAGAFAVATVNVGEGGAITASAGTGSANLPVELSICQTDPQSGQCLQQPGPSVSVQIDASQTPTFAIFVKANGPVAFDPAANRIFVQFTDAGDVVRGKTSVAVTTQ
jgi:hypothetical protein